MLKSGERLSESQTMSIGKILGAKAKVVINAFLIPMMATSVTGLASFAWDWITQPTGYYSYSYNRKEIKKEKILPKIEHAFVLVEESGQKKIFEEPLYLHEFEVLPIGREHKPEGDMSERKVRFRVPDKKTKLYDYQMTYRPKLEKEEKELDAEPKKVEEEGKIFLEPTISSTHMKRLTAKILLDKKDPPTPLFGKEEAPKQPTNPFPWDFAIAILLIVIFAIASWNYQVRQHLSIGDYERIAFIIFIVILFTPLIGGLFRSLLASPLGTYTSVPTRSNGLAELVFPMWMGTAGTFLAGFFIVMAAELVLPHGENPTLARMQGWTTAGLFWGLMVSFLVSIAYEPETLKDIGWHTNGVRYGLVITGILWGLGISLGGYFGNIFGSRFGQPLTGRACGAILGSLIFVLMSTRLAFLIFTDQTESGLEVRSWGEALSQWLSLVFVLVTYYLAKARLESARR
jgi:hypothetical protein